MQRGRRTVAPCVSHHYPRRSVRAPVDRRIAKWLDRHTAQDVCPWNEKFSQPATEEPFTPRSDLAEPNVAVFAEMADTEFNAQFADTPLARAKAAGIRRNAQAVRAHRARTSCAHRAR